MQDATQFRIFARQIFAVIAAIQSSLEQFPPQKELVGPKDWPATQAMLRTVADDLMLCADVDRAVQILSEDQATLIVLVTMTTKVEDEVILQTIQNAYASSPPKSEILPGQAFATYLLEICKGPKPVFRAG